MGLELLYRKWVFLPLLIKSGNKRKLELCRVLNAFSEIIIVVLSVGFLCKFFPLVLCVVTIKFSLPLLNKAVQKLHGYFNISFRL